MSAVSSQTILNSNSAPSVDREQWILKISQNAEMKKLPSNPSIKHMKGVIWRPYTPGKRTALLLKLQVGTRSQHAEEEVMIIEVGKIFLATVGGNNKLEPHLCTEIKVKYFF